jgi:hypothetical protein
MISVTPKVFFLGEPKMHLGSKAPENRKFHWDNTADSATRGKAKDI